MADYNLSLPAETIDQDLLWLDDKKDEIIKQTDLLPGTGQSTTATMTQKAITDALGTKADASSVYTKTQTDTLLNLKADKSTTYTKTETDNLLGNKVDKEAGKGLSSNDYTDAEKTKLGALPTAAELSTDLAAKQDKDTDAVAGNVAVMDAGGNSVDGGAALTNLATKAEVAQIAGEAGLAEAVIDTDGAGTEQEFTFRKSGGDGGAYYRKIKGKTLAWNQLVAEATPAPVSGITYSTPSEGFFGVSGTPASSYNIIASAATILAGHKYIFVFSVKGLPSSASTAACYQIVDSSNAINLLRELNTINGSDVFMGIITPSVNSNGCLLRIRLDTSLTYSNTIYSQPQLIDLTLLYGNEIAGMTDAQILAKYEAEFGTGYHEYNPGALISNDAAAVETTGVNQWDEEWDIGTINNSGKKTVGDYFRSVNFIDVLEGQTYYFRKPSNCSAWLYWYDGSGNYVPMPSGNTYQTLIPGNYTFTVRSGVKKMLFLVDYEVYGSTYNHDICINLSNPAINGQYFPYWKRTLRLGLTTRKDTDGNVPFADGLQSCPTARDEADEQGGVIRVGTRAYQAGDESDADVITDGTNTNYALTTPQTFTWAEPLNLGVKVDENGTERAVAPEGATTPSAPFVADTTYTMSVARMVEILKNL